jgi:hypothetical protein
VVVSVRVSAITSPGRWMAARVWPLEVAEPAARAHLVPHVYTDRRGFMQRVARFARSCWPPASPSTHLSPRGSGYSVDRGYAEACGGVYVY